MVRALGWPDAEVEGEGLWTEIRAESWTDSRDTGGQIEADTAPLDSC